MKKLELIFLLLLFSCSFSIPAEGESYSVDIYTSGMLGGVAEGTDIESARFITTTNAGAPNAEGTEYESDIGLFSIIDYLTGGEGSTPEEITARIMIGSAILSIATIGVFMAFYYRDELKKIL
jgi:hypothetical protein